MSLRLLLDECVPSPLAKEILGHEVFAMEQTVFKGLKNGDLLRAAAVDFDVLITVDKGFEHQQNLSSLPMSVLLLSSRSNKLEPLQRLIPAALEALESLSPCGFKIIED